MLRVVLSLLLAGCSVVTSTDQADLEPSGSQSGDDDDDVAPGDDDDDFTEDAAIDDAAIDDAALPTPDADPPGPRYGTDGVICDSVQCGVGDDCCHQDFLGSYCHDPNVVQCTCVGSRCFPIECDDSSDCAGGQACCAILPHDRDDLDGLFCRAHCESNGRALEVEVCAGPTGIECPFGGSCYPAEFLPEGIGACTR